jgi:hypothetical protein
LRIWTQTDKLALASDLNPQDPRTCGLGVFSGWRLYLKKETSYATDSMPTGSVEAFDFKGSEFFGEFGHTNRHTINIEL